MKIKSTLLFLCLFLFMSAILFAQEKLTARVTGVVDGDTITVLTKDKRQIMLHLSGIDAPEKNQEFYDETRQFLSALILDQIVTVSNIRKDCNDRQTASIAFNNKDLSLLSVKSGMAWADTSCEANELMVKEENAVREKKLGLWEKPNPVKPGDFDPLKQPAAVNSTSTRRIYTGLAPAPPPPKNTSLHIGMTLEEFVGICGNSGKPSTMTTTTTRQSFSVDIPATPENVRKKCDGSFAFDRNGSGVPFKMWMAQQ